MDLLDPGSKAASQAIKWCRDALMNGQRSTAIELHTDLKSIAARQPPIGGTIKLRDLVKELSGKYAFKAWPNHEADWRRLDARSRERIDAIGTTIGENFTIARADLWSFVTPQAVPGTAIVLEGESGAGKSAIAKQLAARSSRSLWLDAADLERSTLHDLETALGLAGEAGAASFERADATLATADFAVAPEEGGGVVHGGHRWQAIAGPAGNFPRSARSDGEQRDRVV
jgi:hypothetical protein